MRQGALRECSRKVDVVVAFLPRGSLFEPARSGLVFRSGRRLGDPFSKCRGLVQDLAHLESKQAANRANVLGFAFRVRTQDENLGSATSTGRLFWKVAHLLHSQVTTLENNKITPRPLQSEQVEDAL